MQRNETNSKRTKQNYAFSFSQTQKTKNKNKKHLTINLIKINKELIN